MANVYKESSGRFCVQFVAKNRKRYSIRLGTESKGGAEYARTRIEDLVSVSKYGHAMHGDTAKWLSELDDQTHARLAKTGVVQPRERKETALGSFIDRYIESMGYAKPNTLHNLRQARRVLVEFFGENKPIQAITAGDADDWRRHLISDGLAENTIRRRTGIARQFFKAAIRKGLIERNPFADLPATVQANTKRFCYVTRAEADKVLAHCPDAEWRVIFALSRFGGLRCPSEHLSLKWADVDWEHNRVLVHSPKTEHHPGGESRLIPLFPELREQLEALLLDDQAPEGAEFVITRYRQNNCNLRTQLERIIKRAGLKPWPKLFQNLRSTRETELAESFPLHVVTAWIGNTEQVAAKHYLQITDDHFKRATEALQKPVQSAGDSERHSRGEPALTPNGAHCAVAGDAGDARGGSRTPTPFGTGT